MHMWIFVSYEYPVVSAYIVDKVIFVLVFGIFHGLLSKTEPAHVFLWLLSVALPYPFLCLDYLLIYI